MIATFLSGFAVSLGLILAIGAQNAFVLRQGLRREHVFLVCLTCGISDAALIAAGVAGFASLVETLPGLGTAMRWGGAAFLAVYGTLALRRALRGGAALDVRGAGAQSWQAALLTCLAFTWLNPHVYLDTLVLIGALAAQSEAPAIFGAGGASASVAFFFALGYGARLLAPVFARPGAWRVLDLCIGLLMWGIAVKLVVM